jgi:hypothetical protein
MSLSAKVFEQFTEAKTEWENTIHRTISNDEFMQMLLKVWNN